MPRGLRQRPVLPPAGHAAIDQRRIGLQHRLRPQPQTLHHARPEPLNQDIRLGAQPQAGLPRLAAFQVQLQGRPPAQVHFFRRRIRRAGAVHANNVRPQIGQQHAGKRRRTDPRKLRVWVVFQLYLKTVGCPGPIPAKLSVWVVLGLQLEIVCCAGPIPAKLRAWVVFQL